MTILVRDPTAADLTQAAVILSDWIDATDWMPRIHSRAEDAAFVRGLPSTHTVRVAWQGEVAGFLARSGGTVDALYVARDWRGKGIGTALLSEAKAVEERLTLWTFQANAAAIGFYRNAGFLTAEQTDGQRNEERLPDMRMIWSKS
ncbi:MAG: GNAT family N-acetyltransferase [Rhodobacteraceae bacterium]|nr:GNAT family N-acetyltransferase [Paracoccaceae bacterium]